MSSRKSKQDNPAPSNILPFRQRNDEYTIQIVPPDWADKSDEFEAVTASCDGMSGEGIYEGDMVILIRGLIRSDGPHVVKTTKDKVYISIVTRKDGLVYLEPSNDEYESVVYKPSEIEVLGCVVRVYPQGDMQKGRDIDPYANVPNLNLIG